MLNLQPRRAGISCNSHSVRLGRLYQTRNAHLQACAGVHLNSQQACTRLRTEAALSIPAILLPLRGQVQLIQSKCPAVAPCRVHRRHEWRFNGPGVFEVGVDRSTMPLRLPVARHFDLHPTVIGPPAPADAELCHAGSAAHAGACTLHGTLDHPSVPKAPSWKPSGTSSGLSNSRNCQSLPFNDVTLLPPGWGPRW